MCIYTQTHTLMHTHTHIRRVKLFVLLKLKTHTRNKQFKYAKYITQIITFNFVRSNVDKIKSQITCLNHISIYQLN